MSRTWLMGLTKPAKPLAGQQRRAKCQPHPRCGGGSTYHQEVINAKGQAILESLPVKNIVHRVNPDGTYRWYHYVPVTCAYGRSVAIVPLFHDPRKNSGAPLIANRGEYFRAFPVDTPQHDHLYTRRSDTESLHNQIKRHFPKMPAYGVAAQGLYILGLVIAQNSMTRAQTLRRDGKPSALGESP